MSIVLRAEQFSYASVSMLARPYEFQLVKCSGGGAPIASLLRLSCYR